MSVKLTIFILSTFLLWTSLLSVSHYNNLSNHKEIKISSELISKAIVADEDFIWKKSTYQLHTVLINFATAEINARPAPLNIASHFAQKSVKFYLLCRVLRN